MGLLWDGAPPTPWGLDDERAAAVEALGAALGPDAPDAERIAAVAAMLTARDPARDDRDPASVRRAGADVFAAVLTALARGRPLARPAARGRPKARSEGQRTTAGGGSGQRTTAVRGERGGVPWRADASVAERPWIALANGDARPRPEQVGALNAALILLADHELAASTFAARVAASAWAGPYRVILAGLGPLAGALLGAAAERGMPAPNVDFALAALVRAHGLRPGSSATIFTVARIAGILAHALEEFEHRLRFRPRASYVGPPPPPTS